MSGLVLNKNKKAFDDEVDFIFCHFLSPTFFYATFLTHKKAFDDEVDFISCYFLSPTFFAPVLTGKNQWLKPFFATTCQSW